MTGIAWERGAASWRFLPERVARHAPEGSARGLHKGARRHGMMAVSGGSETGLADARRKALRSSQSSAPPEKRGRVGE